MSTPSLFSQPKYIVKMVAAPACPVRGQALYEPQSACPRSFLRGRAAKTLRLRSWSPAKLFKATQLTPADFDLYLIQDLPHLSFRNPKIFSDFKAHGTGNLSVLCFFLDHFLQSFSVHNLSSPPPLPFPLMGGGLGLEP